jgi:putative Mg2+ transporter-C (MgtC) family protein
MEIYLNDIYLLLYSALIGCIVGIERELHNRSAGFRTIILICIGSTLFTILAFRMTKNMEHARIVANIITGIGFLGAGVIFRDENRVRGVTTAATIWIAAALGMGIGSGNILLSYFVAFLVIIVLWGFSFFQKFLDNAYTIKRYKIRFKALDKMDEKFVKDLTKIKLKHSLIKQFKENDELTYIWEVSGSSKKHNLIMSSYFTNEKVLEFEVQ